MLDAIWSHLGHRDIIVAGFLVTGLILFWFVPRFMDRVFATIEAIGTRLAQKKYIALFAVSSAVVVIRI